MAATGFPQRIAAVRHFNRFYTKQIGLLHEHLLHSPFSLTEARVVYELAHRHRTTATELRRELGLDAGYLSRLLRRFEQRRLVARAHSATDGRQRVLSLTRQGRRAFARLNADSRRDIGALLRRLPAPEQQRLVRAMLSIEERLGPAPRRGPHPLGPSPFRRGGTTFVGRPPSPEGRGGQGVRTGRRR